MSAPRSCPKINPAGGQCTDVQLGDPEDYYNENDESEWDRLTATLHGQLEWAGTVGQIEASLPGTGDGTPARF